VYIDGIIIFGKNKEEHDQNVVSVLQLLKENSVRINFEKSLFRKEEIKLLGYIIDSQGIRPDTKYLTNEIFSKEIMTKKRRSKTVRKFELVQTIHKKYESQM